jgi:hypothetical protein
MGTHGFDGSELDNITTSLHDQFSTQLSLSSSNDGEEIAASSCPDKECLLAILSLSLKSFKQDATEEDAVKWSLLKSSVCCCQGDLQLEYLMILLLSWV